MEYEVNITLDSRNLDTFDVQAENEEEARERAIEQLDARIVYEVIKR